MESGKNTQKGLSGLGKDIDRTILLQMSDRDLIHACKADSTMFFKVCDEEFFHRVMQQRYPEVPKEATWKRTYLQTVIYVDKMQRRFRYNFVAGDPKIQYSILQKNFVSPDAIMEEAIKKNQIALVKHFLIQVDDDYDDDMWDFILLAIKTGNLEIVQYLVEKSYDKKGAIRSLRMDGYQDIAQYLESNLS